MRKTLLFLLTVVSFVALGQSETMEENLKDRMRTGGMSFNTGSLGVLNGFDNSKGSIEGTAYLDKNFRAANVFFYPRVIKTPQGQTRLDTVPNAPIRINLKDNDVEFLMGEVTKVLPGTIIKEIAFLDKEKETLKNCSEFYFEKPLKGFLRVISNGKYKFYEYSYITIKNPDYNAALNVGSKDTKVIKENKIMALNGENIVGVSSKKDFLGIFGEDSNKAEKIMKAESLSFKKVEDIVRLVELMK